MTENIQHELLGEWVELIQNAYGWDRGTVAQVVEIGEGPRPFVLMKHKVGTEGIEPQKVSAAPKAIRLSRGKKRATLFFQQNKGKKGLRVALRDSTHAIQADTFVIDGRGRLVVTFSHLSVVEVPDDEKWPPTRQAPQWGSADFDGEQRQIGQDTMAEPKGRPKRKARVKRGKR